MKRTFVNVGIAIAALIAIFIILVIVAAIISNNEIERKQYAYAIGYYFGIFLVIFIPATILYVVYQLTIARYSKKEDDITFKDNNDPLDRYLK